MPNIHISTLGEWMNALFSVYSSECINPSTTKNSNENSTFESLCNHISHFDSFFSISRSWSASRDNIKPFFLRIFLSRPWIMLLNISWIRNIYIFYYSSQFSKWSDSDAFYRPLWACLSLFTLLEKLWQNEH